MICSYVGENDLFEQLYMAGEIAIEFDPQGTLAERMRAGGAGIPAFYTRTGVGTVVADGKEQRVFAGEAYLMETALNADIAIVKVWKGDRYGNLIFRKSARNFNPLAAMCARVCVAEVEELIAPGSHDPDAFHPPGIGITLHGENGMMGLGPFPLAGSEYAAIINAGKQAITELRRTTYVDSATSFAMVRGGHLDLSILGGMEVAENGDLANWMVPGKLVKGMGGAMDLVAGVRRIIVLMEHCTRAGAPKFRKRCTLQLTGLNVVDMVITNLGVFARADRKGAPFRLIECAAGVTPEAIREQTEADYVVALETPASST